MIKYNISFTNTITFKGLDIKKILQLLILLFTTITFSSNLATNSVVKIYTAASIPNYTYPWQTSRIIKFTGSGVVISDNRIITSAHVVSNAKFIEVKKENEHKKYIATVKYISHQADLAILEIKDKTFFKNVQPLILTSSIRARDEVTVLGYPIGGNNISTTTGIVSRIEYRSYVWSKFNLLAIQIDAAINSGNSGGAVINNKNELVGIAMMRISKASNIGYIVPSTVLQYFLDDTKDGIVNGYHQDSFYAQKMNNQALKDYYSLNKRTGILVTHVGIKEESLKANDIILSIDNIDISNEGTIKTEYGNVSYSMAFHSKQIGETVSFKVLRDKKEQTINFRLTKYRSLISHEFEKEPRYIIYGGLTFTPLTSNYLSKLSSSSGMNMLFYQKSRTEDYTEPVVSLSTIFPNKVNRGYQQGSYILTKVNDIKIKNFEHLIKVLDAVNDKFTVFEYLEKKKFILNTQEAKESIKSIMKTYNMKSDRRE